MKAIAVRPKEAFTVHLRDIEKPKVTDVENGKGVLPDVVIKDHLLDEEDEILEGLLRRIDQK